MNNNQYERFKHLNFEKFKELAVDNTLSCYEKIGFPDSYREHYEEKIFQDIYTKLPNLQLTQKTIIDIGPGCSEIPQMLINLCRQNQHQLILIDSKEVLDLLPHEDFIIKIAARYPEECTAFLQQYQQKIDVILCYSVLHYIFEEGNIFNFIDHSLKLLKNQGQFLLGDIPNVSKRKRFFSSPAGIQYHQEFTKTTSNPKVDHYTVEDNNLDDAVLLSIMMRCQQAGFDAYLLPQGKDLPMANRRDDILIQRP